MTLTISELLFKSKEKIKITDEELSVGMSGISGVGLSSARPATSKGNQAKVNSGAWAIDQLFLGKVGIMVHPSSGEVYVEFFDYKAYIRNDFKVMYNKEPVPQMKVLPHTIKALLNEKDFPYTREAFQNIKACLDAGLVLDRSEFEHLYNFCDSFYYELKEVTAEVTDEETLNEAMISQAIRTGEIVPVWEVDGIFSGIELLEITDAPAGKEEELSKKDEDTFSIAKAGGYKIDYAWTGDRRKYIPPMSALNEFVPSESYFTMVDLVSHELAEVKDRMVRELLVDHEAIGDNYVNVQFVGRPGTGKTTIANALGATFGMPVRVVINSKNTEEDTFQGMTKVQEGGYKFVETPFLDVYKNGGILLLEEFNLADPGVMMGALGQALEKPFILLEDGYKEVRRHPLCVVIATMNTGTQGSREPSEALTSRMPHVFLLDDPKESEFIEILQKKSGATRQDCIKVYSVYNKIINYLVSPKINAEDVALSMTLRHCLATLKQMSIGRSFKQAIRNTLIGTIAIKDVNLSKDVFDNVVSVIKE